ncbi:YicC/YloC family endoribonuclease [Hoeflea poritis]|uniref:YicC family protein n=1 Tax=Hoeflea poritis TaxID=2993659 RepID=A0ABT4VQJ4_9HYPH|nr:YicC/YloC family endoribonuclease [Hoeflea poritis]MDA4846959.1 YicC family protein [Hoeflea poritis]
MTLQSMTGYAHQDGNLGALRWTWELRSVNGRGLDTRVRVPAGYERLEQDIKKRLSTAFRRGSIQVTLSAVRETKQIEAVVNQDVLDAALALAKRLGDEIDAEPPRIDGILNIRGVLEFNEPVPDDRTVTAEHAAILESLDGAIAALAAMRQAEGEKIGSFIKSQIDGIETLARKADEDPSTEPGSIAERLGMQVRMLLETGVELDEDRLHMEAAILAAKADIREEIDRLFTHVAACRALVEEGGAVGRRLDFLAQEFNRESNTICSKSNASSVTAVGLELKVLIDQFREQIQNLE